MNMASHSTGSVFPFFYTGNLPTPAGAVRRCGLPFPLGRGLGGRSALHPLSTWWRGGRGVRPAPQAVVFPPPPVDMSP